MPHDTHSVALTLPHALPFAGPHPGPASSLSRGGVTSKATVSVSSVEMTSLTASGHTVDRIVMDAVSDPDTIIKRFDNLEEKSADDIRDLNNFSIAYKEKFE